MATQNATTQTKITGPHQNRLKWGIEVHENKRWVEVAATEGNRRDAKRLQREIAEERANQSTVTTTAITTEPTLTLSNFRVTYRAPRYEDGKVLYDGYCAILADDAALSGAAVRVFDVPDVDEGQLAAALFACDAMNQHDQLVSLIKQLREFACLSTWSGSLKKRSLAQEAEKLVKQIDAALATATSK